MKSNRQGNIRTLRGKKGLSSSSGVDSLDPDKETTGGNNPGRLSPSNLGHRNDSKVIHKDFFDSFEGVYLPFYILYLH